MEVNDAIDMTDETQPDEEQQDEYDEHDDQDDVAERRPVILQEHTHFTVPILTQASVHASSVLSQRSSCKMH